MENANKLNIAINCCQKQNTRLKSMRHKLTAAIWTASNVYRTREKRYASFVSRAFQSMRQQDNLRLRRLKDAITFKWKRIGPYAMNATRIIGWKTINALLMGSRYLKQYQPPKFHYCPKLLHRIKNLKLSRNKSTFKMRKQIHRLKTHETNIF